MTRCNFDYFYKYGSNGQAPKTYREVLANKCAPLYAIILECESIRKKDERQAAITKYINYVIDNIYIYIDRDEFKYIFQNIPTVSLDYIRQYLFKVIMFFKSHKVDLIYTNNIYIFDDIYENHIPVIDDMLLTITEEFPDFVKSDDFKQFLNHVLYATKCVPRDKIYMSVYWFKQLIHRDWIPVVDKIAELLIRNTYEENIDIDDEIEGIIHTYELSEYINNRDEKLLTKSNLVIMDSYKLEDYAYLDPYTE